ncbi:hypothetical protein EI94DRAFT_1763535, partial [Lactarius quietus]
MTGSLAHPLDISSSGSQRQVTTMEKPVTEQTQSGAGLSARKVQSSILPSILQDLCKRFRRPRLLKGAPNFKQSIRAAFNVNRPWCNAFLIFIPPFFVCYFSGVNDIAVFCLSFLAIIPLPKISNIAADEISKRLGSLCDMSSVTWSFKRHIVKLILAIQAIRQCNPQVAQSSLIGSIISNLLLTLGLSIFLGGIRFSEQSIGMSTAQTYTTLLMLSVASLLVPTLFYEVTDFTTPGGVKLSTDTTVGPHILAISHGIVVIQLFVYICYQVFKRFSHHNIWGDNDPSIEKSVEHAPIRRVLRMVSKKRGVTTTTSDTASNLPTNIDGSDNDRVPQVLLGSSASTKKEEEGNPQMCLSVAIVVLSLSFLAIFYIGGALVSSIYGVANTINVNQEFANLIVLPISGNLEDKVSALKATFKDKPTKALLVTMGSSIETALFIFPSTVAVSWILRKPLPLLFDPFEGLLLFFSVLSTNYVVQDGKSNWLEGMVLISIFTIFGLMFWFYPGSNLATEVVSCV